MTRIRNRALWFWDECEGKPQGVYCPGYQVRLYEYAYWFGAYIRLPE